MKNERKKTTGLRKLAERLRDPLQFRIFVAVVVLAIGYAGVYMPLETRIADASQSLKRFEEFQRLNEEVEQLGTQLTRISARMPKDADNNEWLQYILGGVRQFPVQLVTLDPRDVRKVGPFEAVVIQIEMSGQYQGLESFIEWIESNERLLRIDALSIAPSRSGEYLEMKLTVLGLRG